MPLRAQGRDEEDLLQQAQTTEFFSRVLRREKVGGKQEESGKRKGKVLTLCAAQASRRFYCELLGFSELVRPGALKERCNGCWLFNYNIGLHLLEGEPPKRTSEIRPEADHFSFQTEDIAGIERELKALGVHYISDEIEHEGVRISQLFFHDPDR